MATPAEEAAEAERRKARRALAIAGALWFSGDRSQAEADIRQSALDASQRAWSAGISFARGEARRLGANPLAEEGPFPRRYAKIANDNAADFAKRAEKAEALSDVDYVLDRVATSQTYRAFDEARREYLRRALGPDLGVERVWHLGSAHPCDVCAPLDGSRAPLHESYPSGLEPGEVHESCRCTEEYELAPSQAMKDSPPRACAEIPNFGMPVPAGGSSCAKCRSFEDHAGRPFCRHPDFIRFLGLNPADTHAVHIPAPDDDPNRYCCNAFSPAAGTMTAKVTLDLGVDDVHIPSVPSHPARTHTMSKLTTAQRKRLPKDQFADPANKAYPIHDAAHTRNAAARLEQQKGSLSPAKYRQIRGNIARAARRFGVDSIYTKRKRKAMSLTIDHPTHGRIEIRHMSDAPEASSVPWFGIEIDADVACSEKPSGPTWIQLAIPGKFYKDGEFFEMNDGTFADIVRNFEASANKRVPIDFEHATELPGSSGSIPVMGAPAQGWITALDNRGPGGLWGLVEWGTLARDYIHNQNYRYISPAIRFNSKDAHTGRNIGARLTSAGLTNTPFLDGMKPLAAKDESMSTPTEDIKPKHVVTMSDGYTMAYSSHEYMPALRGALKLPELATPEVMKEHLGMLRKHFEASGKDVNATPHGVNLNSYMMPMREFLKPPMGSTWDDVLDLVEDLIDAAIDEHEIEEHGAPGGAPAAEGATMTDKTNDLHVQLKDAEANVAKLTLQLKDATSTIALRDTRISELETENKALRAEQEKQAERQLSDKVETAFATYKDTKSLSDDDKKAMLITLKSDPALFDRLYPPVDPSKRQLMRDVVVGHAAPGRAMTTVPESKQVPDMKTLTDKYVKEGLSLEDATSRAYTEIASRVAIPAVA